MLFLCPFLGAACLWDYSLRKIPNFLLFCQGGMGMLYAYWFMGIVGVGKYLLISVLVTIVFFPIFKLGMIGAGDVKLMALSAGFFQKDSVLGFIFYSLLITALVGVVKLLIYRSLVNRIQNLFIYAANMAVQKRAVLYEPDRGKKIKYGVAMSGPILISAILCKGGLF